MKEAPIPDNEKERIAAVHKMAILDTQSETRFDDITKEAVKKLKVPISTITILDSKREWFKSYQGLNKREGERAISFCGHALLVRNIFFVEDTLKDPRFTDNPMVTGSPYIRFYGGIALLDHKTGQSVGVFCIKDTKPRTLSAKEVETFIDLADRAKNELNK
jgi:GAF domain-containing protein